MKKCSRFKHCGFIHKYKNAPSYQGLIKEYCEGEKKKACKRKSFKKKNGYSPSDDMLPNGKIAKT